MSGPAIIPGKRFNPWRYFMNSIFINRFSAVALWFWISGMVMGLGAGSQNVYLFLAGFAAAAIGWPAACWETERGEKEELPRRILAQMDETLDLDKRIAVRSIRRVVERVG